MNNEQQNNDERFYLEELKFGGFAICDHGLPDDLDEVCLYRTTHPDARKAAEAELDRLNAWNRDGGPIRPVEYVSTLRRVPHVEGTFSKAAPLTLTVEEKRRYLAQIFRSPEFSDCDKFKALREDNRMLAMFSLKNGKDPEN